MGIVYILGKIKGPFYKKKFEIMNENLIFNPILLQSISGFIPITIAIYL